MQDRRTDSRTAGDRAGQKQTVQGTAGGQEAGQRETVTDRREGDGEHGDRDRDSRTGAGSGSVREQQHGTTAERED